jgi:hypothetical protein
MPFIITPEMCCALLVPLHCADLQAEQQVRQTKRALAWHRSALEKAQVRAAACPPLRLPACLPAA